MVARRRNPQVTSSLVLLRGDGCIKQCDSVFAFFWGQTIIGSGLAAILNSTTAFFGVIVAGVLLADEPLTPRKIVGTLFGVFGVAAIMGLNVLTNFDLRNVAQLAVLGAALSYAFAGVWGKRHLSKYPPAANAFGMLVGSTLLIIPVVLYADGVPVVSVSVGVWASLFALALLSTAVAYVLYFSILVRAGSANLMLVTLLIPPLAVGLSITFLGEDIRQEAVLGFAFIAFGLIITDGRLLDWIRKPCALGCGFNRSMQHLISDCRSKY